MDRPKSIFEVFAEKLKNENEKYNVTIPWYIMTSIENNDDTINFFKQNNYFGLPKEKISFFSQGQLPMVDFNGKILLESKGRIKEAADGNGGIFEALYRNNILNRMKQDGIEWLGIGNVDNILLNLVDPILIGLAEEKNVLLATKSVTKVSPEEKVGSLCKINGRPGVVEYTEISKEMANLRDEAGGLVYGESYFGMCMFKRKLLEKIGEEKLPYHRAKKKCNYLSTSGEEIIASEPNAFKYESFIFDAFKNAEDAVVLSVKREEEFAPVKNAEGVDSPETARKLYLDYYKKKATI